ncbi:unnamed protein product, partial [Polarella glacialis]
RPSKGQFIASNPDDDLGRGGQRRGDDRRDDGRRQRSESRPQKTATSEFAGITVRGASAEWLNAQQKISGGKFDPSEIQKQAIPRIFDGESCAIQAPTGTGKTLCYLLPLLQRLEIEERDPLAKSALRLLILVPTAVLQMQTAALCRALVGPGRAETVTMLRRDADNTRVSNIVVATPRQILELLDTPLTAPAWDTAIRWLDMVVVDEADRLVAKWNKIQQRHRAWEGK